MTVVGTGVGARAIASGSGGAVVTLHNSLMAGFDQPVHCADLGGSGPCMVIADHSVLPPGPAAPPGLLASEVLRLEDPRFADPAAGDFTLAPDSPALDRAGPTPPGGLSATDLAGRARPADGDGDGAALPDPGAFERQPPAGAPGGGRDDGGAGGGGGGDVPPPDTTAPSVAALRVTGLRARPRAMFLLSEAARVTVVVARRRAGRLRRLATITRALGAGAARVPIARRTVARAGRYRVTVVAIDAAGNRGHAAVKRVRVRPR